MRVTWFVNCAFRHLCVVTSYSAFCMKSKAAKPVAKPVDPGSVKVVNFFAVKDLE
jgi:hypothetical protein